MFDLVNFDLVNFRHSFQLLHNAYIFAYQLAYLYRIMKLQDAFFASFSCPYI